jgi:hypothetical protein
MALVALCNFCVSVPDFLSVREGGAKNFGGRLPRPPRGSAIQSTNYFFLLVFFAAFFVAFFVAIDLFSLFIDLQRSSVAVG